jgi:hypothetical protein
MHPTHSQMRNLRIPTAAGARRVLARLPRESQDEDIERRSAEFGYNRGGGVSHDCYKRGGIYRRCERRAET